MVTKMIDFLLNPWVITLIIVCVFVGNIAALKHTANNVKWGEKRPKTDLDKLNELDKTRHADDSSTPQQDVTPDNKKGR